MADQVPNFNFDQPAAAPQGEVPLASQVVRENFNAIGTLNWTTDPAFPKNPRNGMPRILANDPSNLELQVHYDGAWRTVLEHFEVILAGAKIAKHLEAAFTTAVWTIDHNFGTRPVVQCFDNTNSLVVPAIIQHVQVAGEWARTIVTHAGPVIGYAVLVG